MSGGGWVDPMPPKRDVERIERRAEKPPPVDVEELKRQAAAGRELMKGLNDDAACIPES